MKPARRGARGSAEERVELPEPLWEPGAEGLEVIRLAGVKPGVRCSRLVRKRRQRGHRLTDARPFQRSLVAIVVGRVDALRLPLDPGHLLDRPAIALGDPGGDDPGEGAMVTLDAHDPGCRNA